MTRDLVTRLAPSPTGSLHLGNARTFLVNWALARQRGWRVVLRIEDLDGPRIKPGAVQQVIEILGWLGLDWDEGPIFQSHDLSPYQEALAQLAASGEAYPCRCTRSQIAAAALSAPHVTDQEIRYSGACRPPDKTPLRYDQQTGNGEAWRLRAPDDEIAFNDQLVGPVSHNVQQSVGDFVIGTKAGLPSYQLAVAVDDARQGVTHIVRGDDLLLSTPRQLLLYDRLELGDPPQYFHVPMVLGEDGRRIAKRHGDTSINFYRSKGVSSERVMGLLAEWCGLPERGEMPIEAFLNEFRIDGLRQEAVTFTTEDNSWLLAGK